MKHRIVYFSLSLLIFFSCSKEKVTSPEDAAFDKAKALLEKITNLKTEQTKQIAYSSLTVAEKASVWKTKLILASRETGRSSAQVQMIQDLASKLRVEVFQDGDARQVFKNGWLVVWLDEASKVFTSKEIFDLVFTISPADYALPKVGKGKVVNNVPAPHACVCRRNSSMTCGHWNLSSWPYVWSYYPCDRTKEGCLTNPDVHCGAFWDETCDGDKCEWMTNTTPEQ